MKANSLLAVASLACLLAFPSSASSDDSHPDANRAIQQDHVGMRCGTYLISLGDPKYSVLQKCGQPAYREFRVASSYSGRARSYFEVWTYDQGPHTFLRS